MKNALEVCELPSNHSVYFDNFFSSYQLLSDLDKRSFWATGAMRKYHAMKCPLIDIQQMKRKERVSYDNRSNRKLDIFCWNGSSLVTLASNAYSFEPVGTFKRWVEGIRKLNVNQSAVIYANSQGWD